MSIGGAGAGAGAGGDGGRVYRCCRRQAARGMVVFLVYTVSEGSRCSPQLLYIPAMMVAVRSHRRFRSDT